MRELLTPQPLAEIAGLPFNEEGYNKAVELLKRKYDVKSELMHAHGKNILMLPVIRDASDTVTIHNFYRTLNTSVNSLKTMGKIASAEILVREVLEKLGPVKPELIKNDSDWQLWNFEKLLDELRDFTIRFPEKVSVSAKAAKEEQSEEEESSSGEKNFQFPTKSNKKLKCVYCKSEQYVSRGCNKVKSVKERKSFLRKNQLCFNCAGKSHAVKDCRSRGCSKCHQKHHTSICYMKKDGENGANKDDNSLFLVDHQVKETIHPTLIAIVKGQKFRILLDTGSGSSYISSTVVKHLGCAPVCWESKQVETMTDVVKQNLPLFKFEIQSTNLQSRLMIKASQQNRDILTTISNPHITQLKKKYPLRGIGVRQ